MILLSNKRHIPNRDIKKVISQKISAFTAFNASDQQAFCGDRFKF